MTWTRMVAVEVGKRQNPYMFLKYIQGFQQISLKCVKRKRSQGWFQIAAHSNTYTLLFRDDLQDFSFFFFFLWFTSRT